MTFQEIRSSLQDAFDQGRELTGVESIGVLRHHVNLILDKLIEDEEGLTIHGVSGLKRVDPTLIAEFRRTMTEEVIPEIIKTIEQRQKAARQLGHV